MSGHRASTPIPGEIQPDGSLLFRVDTPPTATAVALNGATFAVPDGATSMRIVVTTTDTGETTYAVRAGYEGTTTT